jgi:hypothetical protein
MRKYFRRMNRKRRNEPNYNSYLCSYHTALCIPSRQHWCLSPLWLHNEIQNLLVLHALELFDNHRGTASMMGKEKISKNWEAGFDYANLNHIVWIRHSAIASQSLCCGMTVLWISRQYTLVWISQPLTSRTYATLTKKHNAAFEMLVIHDKRNHVGHW